MTRHGVSHSAAAVFSTAAAGVLIDPFRELTPRLSYVMDQMSWAIFQAFSLPPHLTPELLSTLLLAGCLAFLWGVIFAVANGFSGR